MFGIILTEEDPLYEIVISLTKSDFSGVDYFYDRTCDFVHAIVFDIIPDERIFNVVSPAIYDLVYKRIGELNDLHMLYTWIGCVATDVIYGYICDYMPQRLTDRVDYAYGRTERVAEFAGSDTEAYISKGILNNKDCINEIKYYLDDLPVLTKVIKQKYFYEDMSLSNIAASLNMDAGEVSCNIAYIKAVLRYVISRYPADNLEEKTEKVNSLEAVYCVFAGDIAGAVAGEAAGLAYVAGKAVTAASTSVAAGSQAALTVGSGATGGNAMAGFLATTAGKIAIGAAAVCVTAATGAGTYFMMRHFNGSKGDADKKSVSSEEVTGTIGSEEASADFTERDSLVRYYEETLKPELGVLETDITGSVDVTWDNGDRKSGGFNGRTLNSEPWFDKTGILNYRIADFDYDGSLELLLVAIKDAPDWESELDEQEKNDYRELPGDKKCVYLDMYELHEGDIGLSDEYLYNANVGSNFFDSYGGCYYFSSSTNIYEDFSVRIMPGKDAVYIGMAHNSYQKYPMHVDSYSPYYMNNDVLYYKDGKFDTKFRYVNHAAPIPYYYFYRELSDGSYNYTSSPTDIIDGLELVDYATVLSDEFKPYRTDEDVQEPRLLSQAAASGDQMLMIKKYFGSHMGLTLNDDGTIDGQDMVTIFGFQRNNLQETDISNAMYEEKYNIKVDMTFTAINTSDDGRYESVGDGETSSASEDTQKEKITETTTEKATETETDEETEETDYVIPYSSDRYLTNDDLVGLSSEELMYARNEIYARHGYIFNDAEIRAYFEKKPWYTGTVKSEDFSSSVFNDYEYKNVTFLKKHQDGEHTGYSAESE